MSIVRIGLGENKKFGDGYDAIFGKIDFGGRVQEGRGQEARGQEAGPQEEASQKEMTVAPSTVHLRALKDREV